MDVVLASSITTSKKMRLMIGNPGHTTGKGVPKMDIKGGTKDSTIRGKNMRTERVESAQRVVGLTFEFGDGRGKIRGVALLIAESPEVSKGGTEIVKSLENARTTDKIRETGLKVGILQGRP